MKAAELKKKYLDFFVKKGHKVLPNASLVPENDPTALFISAGMHPLVPYLLGEPHSLGKKLCSVQKCIRTVDIDSVGDFSHLTFFEMLGNWSLGDYWKEEAISWSYEFLTKHLNISPEKLSVTCFAGDKDAPRDKESAEVWRKLGIPKQRIYFLPKEDNWWGPAGITGPCGPDSEMFFDTGKKPCGPSCRPGDNCGKYMEIWNDVFMQYNKTVEGKFVPLKQKNVDTGMGIERTVPILNGMNDVYETELFTPIIAKIEEISKRKYLPAGRQVNLGNQKPMRIIADHLRAATFIIADGVTPSNTEQGYILRRLIRRSIRYGKMLGLNQPFTAGIAEVIVDLMADSYPQLVENQEQVIEILTGEEKKFSQTLKHGLREFEKLSVRNKKISGKDAFFLYETYGFPFELIAEIVKEKNLVIDKADFEKSQKEHQQKSRAGAEKKFAGGLADHSETVIKYHTATHLIHAALRKVLGKHVHQVGSNLTAERLRFDFTHPDKLTEKQLKEIENLVNQKITQNLPVKMEIMALDEAKKQGALAFFEQKYTDKVKVYSIGDFSKEICGGPHAKNTGEIGKVEIFKEESCGAGKRRLYARIK